MTRNMVLDHIIGISGKPLPMAISAMAAENPEERVSAANMLRMLPTLTKNVAQTDSDPPASRLG